MSDYVAIPAILCTECKYLHPTPGSTFGNLGRCMLIMPPMGTTAMFTNVERMGAFVKPGNGCDLGKPKESP